MVKINCNGPFWFNSLERAARIIVQDCKGKPILGSAIRVLGLDALSVKG